MRGPWLAGIALVVALTACSSTSPTTPPAAAPSTTTAPTPAPIPTTTPVSPGTLEYHDGHPVEPPSNPTWDDLDRAEAVDAATAAMELFARPDVPYEQWWTEIAPLMSPQAQIDYQYVDPINVPARAVTGPAVLVDDTSASVAGVEVPTDVGPYTVVLSRADEGAPWLVERISPPEGLG